MAAREEDAALDDLEGGDHVPLNPSGHANGEYGESASAPSSKCAHALTSFYLYNAIPFLVHGVLSMDLVLNVLVSCTGPDDQFMPSHDKK